MNRKILSIISIAAVLTTASILTTINLNAASTTVTTSSTVLKKGSSGDAVKTLQKNLTSLGFDTKGVDGSFGTNTYNAVIAFQDANRLAKDGVVGPYTQSKIAEALSIKSILRKGDSGTDVKQLQIDLTSLGFSTNGTDGSFGTNTYNAVIAFQKAYGLDPDGICGPKTKSKISQALQDKTTILRKGSSGDEVTLLQKELTSLGFDTLGIDGEFGTNTYNAVISFQKKYGLSPDGAVGPDTRGQLDELLTKNTNTLQYGSSGEAVRTLQEDLFDLGFDSEGADGQFGQNTKNAVIAFQKEYNLTANGIVGSETRGRIDDILYLLKTDTSNIIRKGDSGTNVKTLQQNLNTLGYSTFGIDGLFGTNTYNAVVSFQREHGFKANGLVGIQTQNAIKCAINKGEKRPTNPPSGKHDITTSLVNFVATYEAFSSKPYRGKDYQNQTIGYGHVIKPGEKFTTITKSEAKDLLYSDLQKFVSSTNSSLSETSVSQQQFDSLVSFSFNCGAGALSKSTLLKDVKAGKSNSTIKTDFLMWVKCNGEVLRGLVNRRTDEWEIYANGEYNRDH